MKILAIKGGGVRGLLTARLGERLDKRQPGWSDSADLLAGTSTGGILALGLAAGKTWKDLRKLYQKNAKRIFKPAFPAVLAQTGEYLGGNWSASPEKLVPQSIYSSEGLREVLDKVFGDRRLGDLERDVLVPAFSLVEGNWKALWFTRQREGNLRVVDVAMATSAAPVYFPASAGCIDGGIIANDPSVAALAHAVKQSGPLELLTGMSVLTMGCGRGRRPRGFVESIMDGGLLGPIAKAIDLLGSRHHEIDPKLPNEIPLDGGSLDGNMDANLAELLAIANETKLNPTLDWLEDQRWIE